MIRKIEIERFSTMTSKSFDEVVTALDAAIAHPNMAEFWISIQDGFRRLNQEKYADISGRTAGVGPPGDKS